MNKKKVFKNNDKVVWPFPPATGAVPWSKKQITAYEKLNKKSNKKQLPDAPF